MSADVDAAAHMPRMGLSFKYDGTLHRRQIYHLHPRTGGLSCRRAHSKQSVPSASRTLRRLITRNITTLLLALASLAACTESFEPVAPTDEIFSLLGSLNAAADTQWIRVSPVRDVIVTEPGPIDAVVTLRHVESGREVEMRDSAWTVFSSNEGIQDNLYTHVFWTTEPILHDQTYVVTATRSDGASTTATVVTPPAITGGTVSISLSNAFNSDSIMVEGVEHLAFVWVIHDTMGSQRQGNDGAPLVARGTRLGRRLAIYDDQPPPPPPQVRPPVCTQGRRCWIKVDAVAEQWPFSPTMSDADLASARIGNVERGTGLVAGYTARLFPYERCRREGVISASEYCRLKYNSESASLRGSLIEATCRGEPVAKHLIALREIGGDHIREIVTEADGAFWIGGLPPGSAWRLLIRPNGFTPFDETLVFSAGEEKVLDIRLTRENLCPFMPPL